LKGEEGRRKESEEKEKRGGEAKKGKTILLNLIDNDSHID